MRKIDWKKRFTNKTTLVAIILAFVTLVYQVLGLANVIAPVSQEQIIEVAGLVINLLVLLGIVVDPTTKGIQDSEEAAEYDDPN